MRISTGGHAGIRFVGQLFHLSLQFGSTRFLGVAQENLDSLRAEILFDGIFEQCAELQCDLRSGRGVVSTLAGLTLKLIPARNEVVDATS